MHSSLFRESRGALSLPWLHLPSQAGLSAPELVGFKRKEVDGTYGITFTSNAFTNSRDALDIS